MSARPRDPRPAVGPLVGAAVVILTTAAGTAATAGPPAAGSPGGTTSVTRIATPCPTFSWGHSGATRAYELSIHHLDDEEEALRRTLPGSASSWTPDLGDCLEPGGRYAWTIRATGDDGASAWSEPRLFEVAAGADPEDIAAALAIVRDYLVGLPLAPSPAGPTEREKDSVDLESIYPQDASGAKPATARRGAADTPSSRTPRMPAAADADLQVDGSPVVTVATLGGALCGATKLRYLDQGDGTVLDCNTGLIWLKDADCLNQWAYDHPSEPTIFDKIVEFNNGDDFGCADYTPGTHADWRIPRMEEFCGQWDGSCSGTACCDGSHGIIDAAYSGWPSLPFPWAIANARGDAPWDQDDAFFIQDRGERWAIEAATPGWAWEVSLDSGRVNASLVDSGYGLWPVR